MKDPEKALAALAKLPLTPAEHALCACYTKVTAPKDATISGARWQIVLAIALLDRLAKTDPVGAGLLCQLLVFPSVTGVFATAASRDGDLRLMRAKITGEDPDTLLRPKRGQAA
jgi:hypothetical protein